jgi:class 3 adenylate cyclase/TolB-like protein/tetratricopeptide (TPR) repeat protein
MAEDRRLAAIMFTDIVGYTALMGKDENEAFKLLRLNRNIQKPLIKKHNGKWLKEMGDGILASFQTASDAVKCAIDIQQKCLKEAIKLRIGIHTGEVVFEGSDVLGDGVNVASRLEELAQEGDINISGAVYKDVKNKAGITTEYIGERSLKNVEEPVKVYKVNLSDETVEVASDIKQKPFSGFGGSVRHILLGIVLVISVILIWKLISGRSGGGPDIDDTVEKTIAVIPFWNDSPDKDNAYFCSGMEEEIRIQLLKISDLLIESRQSVEKYRENPDPDIESIGKELDVSYILEGSVRKISNDVRVTVQLINAISGDHLWGDTYDGSYNEQLLEFQSNTAKKIAAELHAAIAPDEEKRIDKIPTNIISSYDYTLKGDQMMKIFWRTGDINYRMSALEFYDQALESDPAYVRAIIGKGQVYLHRRDYDSAYYYAEKALMIDDDIPESHMLMGSCNRSTGKYDLGISSYLKAIDLSPNDWWPNFVLGEMYINNKSNIVKGLPYIQKAYDLCTEERGSMYYSIGISYFNIDDFDKVEYYYKKAIEFDVGCSIIMNYGWLYHNMGEFQKALEIEDSLCNIMDCPVICNIQKFYTHLYLENYEEALSFYDLSLEEGLHHSNHLHMISRAYVLRKLGRLTESNELLEQVQSELESSSKYYETANSKIRLAMISAMQNDKDNAIKYLKEFEAYGYSVWFNEIKIFPVFENLWDEPEFIALVERIDKEKANLRAAIRQMEQNGEISF